MSNRCLHCEGWGCRRCRSDYGEQMPDAKLKQLLERALSAIGFIPDGFRARMAQAELRRDISEALRGT